MVMIMVAPFLLAACGKQEQPKAADAVPAAPMGYGGRPNQVALQHTDEQCQAIKDKNNDVSTLNYELQNAGCPLVDLRTYKK